MCTVQSPLPHGKLCLSGFGPVQDFSFVLQHTTNHCHLYIDSTTVLFDNTLHLCYAVAEVLG